MRRTDELNTEERRQQLVNAAVASFNKLGLHGASISTICKEAGLSPGHLYYYFSNKEELVEAVFKNEWDVGQRFLDALVGRKHGLAIYLGLYSEKTDDLPISGVTNNAFTLEVLAEVSRNSAISAVNKGHRKLYLDKLAEMVAAARARGEVAKGVTDAQVVGAVDLVATARYVQEAARRYDDAAFRGTAGLLLKGVLKLP
jgi:TetR/AcrR family transcriptional repressor of uid operon